MVLKEVNEGEEEHVVGSREFSGRPADSIQGWKWKYIDTNLSAKRVIMANTQCKCIIVCIKCLYSSNTTAKKIPLCL